MAVTGILLLPLLGCVAALGLISGNTSPHDEAALRSLMNSWENTPPSWAQSTDPCGSQWEGVFCNGFRITTLKLSTMGLKGTLTGDIGQLSQLESLDLSFNPDLHGSLIPNIGNLKKLTTLILGGCSFSGSIPSEIGNLPKLAYIALNSNKFSGRIPASLGSLTELYWLDLADNQLTGPLPLSNDTSPGLDLLLHTKHFHFNKNQLSGPIPQKLFSQNMSLIHLLLHGNRLTGNIPESIGLVQSLEVLRLDQNSLSGPVPSSIQNLTKIGELNLANNNLTGVMPDLTGMDALNYVDLSNNTFDPSEAPAWFTNLQSLTALVIQSGGLQGEVPKELFSIPGLQQVILDNNKFDGTLAFVDSNISQELQVISFKSNDLTALTVNGNYNGTLMLIGNPVCGGLLSYMQYCHVQSGQISAPNSTSTAKCGPVFCQFGQSLNPRSCRCAYPYQVTMTFVAPFFRDLTNTTLFQSLETSLCTKLGLTPGSVFLQNPFFDSNSNLELQLKLFPSDGMYFNRSEIIIIGFQFNNQTYNLPRIWGPYYFIGSPYPFLDDVNKRSSVSKKFIVGIIGGALILIGVIAVGFYAIRQKKRAEQAKELSRPFASWASSKKGSGGAPQLKGARWFSYDELRKSTNNFSEINEIGLGGYGKVYRGLLTDGQIVAIKRSHEHGSMQGEHEFKTEIELLSRVHHRNLVGLVGFCFEEGEMMLVYEYIHNGTLRESLSGRSGLQLDWKKRLRIALGSAKGIAYLHELADPPIIHRDIKTTNILLNENLTAKVADFGLCKLVSDSDKGQVSTQVKGTFGYLDPEYYMTQQLTEKSDVYSFGVVMLELITARQPIERGKYIVHELTAVMDDTDKEYYGLKEEIDPLIKDTVPPIGFRRFVELAMQCVEATSANRPTMSNIVREIEVILHGDGLNTRSGSISSIATDFVISKGSPRDPYNNPLPAKESSSSDASKYSGDGLNTKSTSASSSTTDFTTGRASPRHPYDDSLPAREINSDAFKYSGGYTIITKLESK